MAKRLAWGAAGLVLGLAAALALPSVGRETPTPEPDRRERTITVTGSAVVEQEPDEAVVTLGVRTQASSAEEAVRANAQRMAAVLDALRALEVRPDDLATAGFQLRPRYGDDGLQVVGYTVENRVRVTVRELARVGRVIDRAVAAGANLAGGVRFRVSGEGQGRERALAEAVADARAKAEALLGAAGASLGEVLSAEEVSRGFPEPVVRPAALGFVATAIEPPTLEGTVTVRVVWAIA